MNIKINTICFILLLFFLIGVASAADSDNETLKQTINQSDDTVHVNMEHHDKFMAKTDHPNKLEASNANKQPIRTSKPITTEKLKVTINAPNLKMHYKDGSKFTVTLKDSSKKVMKKAKVKISINGKTYTKTTDSKGKATLTINLKSGTYSVTTTFDETKTHCKKSAKSSVVVKSTIKCSDFTKYYKNKASYFAGFYDTKGRHLKNTNVKFKINGQTYTVKTNNKGVGKLAINLNPGTYSISSINSKTSEEITKKVTIKTTLLTNDLTMLEKDGTKFNVKVLNSNGKASPNKKVSLKVNGKVYSVKTNSNGIATQTIDFGVGKYKITIEYGGLKNTNTITINKNSALEDPVKKSEFIHSTVIPNYVNVTLPYAFHNSEYTLKTGSNGTVKMPKVEVYTIEIGSKVYKFTTGKTNTDDAITLNQESKIIPFNGTELISSVNKDSINEDGIIITKNPTSIQIDYRDKTCDNIELFGFYVDKGIDNSETFTYLKNDKVMAKVNVQTQNFDETGVRYSLAKLYQKSNMNFNYEEILNQVPNPIIFTNTGQPVTYSYFTNFIAGYQTMEDIRTTFTINGREELEKSEQISYGRANKYRTSLGFEILQAYSIINEKVNQKTVANWISKNSPYINRFGVMNVYGMHLASLETAWLADEVANQFAGGLNVIWNRQNTTTILGGINLDDTYLHILNADMGMGVSGDNDNITIFRLMNSIYLPNIENYVLQPVGERYWDNTTSSLDNILNSVENNNFSITQIDEMFYIQSEDGTNSIIVLNSTSGICNVILVDNDFAYKGALIPTTHDCCSVGILPQDLIKGINNNFNKFKNAGGDIINNIINKIHPLASLLYKIGSLSATIIGKLAPGATTGLASTIGLMFQIHSIGREVKNNFMDENSWHWAYKHVTFTRESPLEGKKFFNIPKSDGTYDYIEVGINSDGSLDRNNALYVGDGYTKKLTKSETYKYFTEEKWTSCNIPRKYQKNELPLIFG